MLQKQKTNITLDKSVVEKAKVAIVRTEYHKGLLDNLEEYCINTLRQHGVREENIKIFTAPGSWEIPLLVQAAAKSKKFDAIITFGIIVKGETYHFDMIANECARAIMQLSLDYSIPIAIEVLAVNTLEQAEERAGKNNKNKGIEGAIAVLKVLSTLSKI
jgi:6,7-dimethyl-8-ribityllumazine synthase